MAKEKTAATKKTPAKKTAAGGKGSAGKKAKTASAGRSALAKELTGLIPELDEEGLAFLIEQARVHLYNMKIAALEEEAQALERSSERTRRAAGAKAVAEGRAVNAFSIQASEDGGTYHVVYAGKWKMFNADEMKSMVRLVQGTDSAAQAGARLYRWFLAERSDVFQDLPFSGLADPRLKELAALLRKTFTIKGTTKN